MDFKNHQAASLTIYLHVCFQLLVLFVHQTAGIMEEQNCTAQLNKSLKGMSVFQVLSPFESLVDLQLLNQNVSHIILALVLLPQQLTNCGKNILFA